MAHLELRDVSVAFDGRPVLRRVNLRIERGESITLVGPSGHGKSLILKLCAGLLKPDGGRVFLDGEDLAGLSAARLNEIRLTVGMLFQKNALFDSLTAFENVAFGLTETTALRADEVRSRALEYLGLVGLSEVHDHRPDALSGGMQKRLGIARALSLKPRTVFYDDPTAGLDPITSRSVVDLILEMRRRDQATIVSVTNEMSRAFQLADRIVLVAGGDLIVTGTPSETLAHADPKVSQFVRGLIDGPLSEVAPAGRTA